MLNYIVHLLILYILPPTKLGMANNYARVNYIACPPNVPSSVAISHKIKTWKFTKCLICLDLFVSRSDYMKHSCLIDHPSKSKTVILEVDQ